MRLSLYTSLDDLIQNCWESDKWAMELSVLGLNKYCSKIFEDYQYEEGKKIIAWCTYCFSTDSERIFLCVDWRENKKIVASEFDIEDSLLVRILKDKNVKALCLTILYASADKNVVDLILLRQAKENLMDAATAPCYETDAELRKAHFSTVADCAIKASKIGERISKLEESSRKKLELLNQVSEEETNESFEERVAKLTEQSDR